jgi:hypothetical protein
MISKKRLMFNAATLIPGVSQLAPVRRVLERHARVLERDACGSQGTEGRYCYSVWLRHLVSAAANGLNCSPKAVAELGPGDSLVWGSAPS